MGKQKLLKKKQAKNFVNGTLKNSIFLYSEYELDLFQTVITSYF